MIFYWWLRNCRNQIMNNFGVLFSVFGIQESLYSYFICFISCRWCQFLFMVILFLTFYLLGIKFSELTWKIWILIWCWMIFHVWKIPILSFLKFEFSLIGMDCSGSSQWIFKSSTQRFCINCCFWCHVHSLIVTHCVINSVYPDVIFVLQVLRLSCTCY